MRVGDNHYPIRSVGMPDDLRIPKVEVSDGEDGVVFVLREGVSVVKAVGDVLILVVGAIGSVDCHHAISLIREEAGCVVHVDYCAAGEDACHIFMRKQSDLLVRPVVQVGGCSVTPVLISRDGVCRIILIVQMVNALGVEEHSIGIIHEANGRGEMDLRAIDAIVCACYSRTSRCHLRYSSGLGNNMSDVEGEGEIRQ